MGHDILGFNKARKEIAYARFSMGNYNSYLLYSLLDADDYHAGVSGTGDIADFSLVKIETALQSYEKMFGKVDSKKESEHLLDWDQRQILDFIQKCLITAKEEGSVKIYFG